MLRNKRGHNSERPAHRDEEWPPLATTGESPSTAIRLTADFSAETLQARREWHDILKVMKGKNLKPRLLYPARVSLRFDREIKSFTDKQKLREFSPTKPALQQMLKELL